MSLPRILQNRWSIVAASLCGLIVGLGPLHLFAFNIFIKPVSEEPGLSWGALGSAVGSYALLNTLAVLAVGWMLDRADLRQSHRFPHKLPSDISR